VAPPALHPVYDTYLQEIRPKGYRTSSPTDVGRRVPAEEDAVSEVSEAELREWEEEHEPEQLGAGEGPLLFLPTADFMAKGSLQRAATAWTADKKWTVHNLAMI